MTSIKDLESKGYYKVDISDYGNSIDIDILLGILRKKILPEDWDAVDVIYKVLRNDRVRLMPFGNGRPEVIIDDHRGAMTGMPFAPFMLNMYLSDMDDYFYDRGVDYYRFNDDVLIVAERNELQQHIDALHRFVSEKNLTINPSKEFVYGPNDRFVFLGIQIAGRSSAVSLEAISFQKLAIKRIARQCRHMVDTGRLSPYEAFVTMIGRHNTYFYGSDRMRYCFSNLYFQMINSSENLGILDRYAQDCIRYVYVGRFRESNRIKVPYEWFRDAGYVPLVSAFRIYMDGRMPQTGKDVPTSSELRRDLLLPSRSAGPPGHGHGP